MAKSRKEMLGDSLGKQKSVGDWSTRNERERRVPQLKGGDGDEAKKGDVDDRV